jgi:SulP family sulfate permease
LNYALLLSQVQDKVAFKRLFFICLAKYFIFVFISLSMNFSHLFNHLSFDNLKGDVYGGLTAAVIALPLALAFGVSSGAGAIAGVYGAIFVGFFAALFGGTATQISGPTGPMTVVMAIVLTQMIATNPENGLALAFTSVIFAGLIQIAFGLLKLGKYFVMVPYAVVSGFMSGIGVIIILLELAPLLGVHGHSSVLESVKHFPETIDNINTMAAITGFSTLALVIFWPKVLARFVPAPLFALLATTLTVALFLAPDAMPIIGDIPSGFPDVIFNEMTVPDFSLNLLQDVFYYAFLLAVLGAIDSLLTSMVADTMTETHHLSDKELIGQGIGNTVAGFFGALPGAGATMRTAINIRAGGQTALSGIVHSLTLLVIVLWAGDLAKYVPHAVLAGMLMKVGIDIIDWRFISRLRQVPLFSSMLMLLVLTLTVFVDLISAVMVGMFIANIVTLDRLAHIQLDNISFTRADELVGGVIDGKGRVSTRLKNTLVFEIDGPISFAVSRELSRRFSENTDFETLIIDLSQAHLIGTTTAVMVIDLIESSQSKNKEVLMVLGHDKINASLRRLSLDNLIPSDKQFKQREQALNALV